eukprot:1993945-Rhodomonas_salina.6
MRQQNNLRLQTTLHLKEDRKRYPHSTRSTGFRPCSARRCFRKFHHRSVILQDIASDTSRHIMTAGAKPDNGDGQRTEMITGWKYGKCTAPSKKKLLSLVCIGSRKLSSSRRTLTTHAFSKTKTPNADLTTRKPEPARHLSGSRTLRAPPHSPLSARFPCSPSVSSARHARSPPYLLKSKATRSSHHDTWLASAATFRTHTIEAG